MDSNLNEILKELKKLRQENIDLKNKNAQLERKELQYAQKFMRARTSGTSDEPVNVPNGEKGIEDLIEKYNKKIREKAPLTKCELRLTNCKFLMTKQNTFAYSSKIPIFVSPNRYDEG